MTDASAPHGRDDAGTPLAPYGLNLDGTPRKSNRGARPGQRGNGNSAGKRRATTASLSTSNLTDVERKGMLCELGDMLLVNPLATASQVPVVQAKIGRHADALAGDAFILSQYLPSIADGLLMMAKAKPGVLSWLDKIEENAPYVLITQALIGVGKAIADNHLRPNPELAKAGRSLAALKMAAMADAVNQQAENITARAAAQAQEAADFAAAA